MQETHNDSPRKLHIGILFGGKSAEHEVSLQSAKNVLQALNTDAFEPVLIGIDKHGRWHFDPAQQSPSTSELVVATDDASLVTLLPGGSRGQLVFVHASAPSADITLDAVFPILHGPMGEDGSLQGMLELAGIPYVGPGVLGSAVGMDKDIMKRLLHDGGIAVADYEVVRSADLSAETLQKLVGKLGLPLFVKPANMGSSVGISKVSTTEELAPAIAEALLFDTKVLVERAVIGDEIECAVLGNTDPKASIIGRIIPKDGFYSYAAKYTDEDGAILEIPAAIPEAVAEQARQVALDTFAVLGCEGMSRIDMFAGPGGQIVVNEINTIPGFTKISMYPKLWEASGVSYTELITQLIDLAIERFERRQHLQTTYKNHL